MYERSLDGNLARTTILAILVLFDCGLDFCLRCGCRNFFLFLVGFIYPIVHSDCTSGVFLYLISQLQVRYQSLSQYVVQCGCADFELLCHSSLLLIVTLHPLRKLIHLCPFLLVFLDEYLGLRYSREHSRQNGKTQLFC